MEAQQALIGRAAGPLWSCKTLKKAKGVWGPHLEVVKDPMGWGQRGALGFFRDVGSQSKRSPEPHNTYGPGPNPYSIDRGIVSTS